MASAFELVFLNFHAGCHDGNARNCRVRHSGMLNLDRSPVDAPIAACGPSEGFSQAGLSGSFLMLLNLNQLSDRALPFKALRKGLAHIRRTYGGDHENMSDGDRADGKLHYFRFRPNPWSISKPRSGCSTTFAPIDAAQSRRDHALQSAKRDFERKFAR